LALVAAGWLLAISWGGAKAQTPAVFPRFGNTMALDPGHGGKDTGAKGESGATEKQICLALARRVTNLMEPALRIVLTRADDVAVSPVERSAIANSQNAGVLISIHAGAGFGRTASGVAIYYYQPAVKSAGRSDLKTAGEEIPLWQELQLPHLASSQRLAEMIRQAIQMVAGIPEVRLVPAPLVVLQSAAMPAVLIEAGYLTNPTDEERLSNPQQQEVLAQAIFKGVESFLAQARSLQ
jgi:N-acetylmuramoyl-L-alanine amidase